MSRAHENGMSPFRAGVIALVIVGLFAYFGFSKNNPFANPYEFKAVFNDVNNLKPKSPVRIAGVEVGKVTKVEAVEDGKGAAEVTMEVEDKGLPIKKDAHLKIRPRIFLEGNFFVDLEPGTPSAEELDDGGTIPVTQTAAPVQFGDVLTALQRDTRTDLQTFLREYSKALAGGGAEGAGVRARRAAGRALVRRDARGRAAVHAPGAAPDVRARAARQRARPSAHDPGGRRRGPQLDPVAGRDPRSLGVHQQRARAVHAARDPKPGRARER